MSAAQDPEQAAEPEEVDYASAPGPGIPELPPVVEAPPVVEPAVVEQVFWEREQIETFLKGLGEGVHMLAGVAEDDWKMTQADLERIAPPLTRICNRYEPVLKLAPVADPLMVAYGFGLYGWRSALARKRALRDLALEQTGPGYEPPPEQPPGAPEAASNGRGAYFPESPRARSDQ